MKKHPVIAAVILAALALFAYYLGKPRNGAPGESPPSASEKPFQKGDSRMAPGRIPLSVPARSGLAAVTPHPDAVAFGRDPSAAGKEPQQLFRLFEFYRETFGGFPSGEGNAHFMNALRGANPERLPIFPESHPRLNREGELLDFWGSPFFFHQISSDHIEIRSPGPDREIFTEDDITVPNR